MHINVFKLSLSLRHEKEKNKTGVTLYNLSTYLMKVAFKIFKILMKVKYDHSTARNLIKQCFTCRSRSFLEKKKELERGIHLHQLKYFLCIKKVSVNQRRHLTLVIGDYDVFFHTDAKNRVIFIL